MQPAFLTSSAHHFLPNLQGELVAGILDKAAFGKHGLLHGIQELYGDTMAGNFLSSLSRLFTYYTQVHGFTCGIDDILLKSSAELKRAEILARAEETALKASTELVKASLPPAPSMSPSHISAALSEAYRTNAGTGRLSSAPPLPSLILCVPCPLLPPPTLTAVLGPPGQHLSCP